MTILQLQQKLALLKFYTGELDGLPGPETKNALIAFQKAYGLQVDGMLGPKTENALNQSPGPITLKGIDVSGYQPNTDWLKVKQSGIQFAFIKATESINYINPFLKKDAESCHEQGIISGSYHFLHPDIDGAKQADYFLNVTSKLNLDLPPVVDIEVTKNQTPRQIGQCLNNFLTLVANETKKTPIIYTGADFFNHNVEYFTSFERYPLWIAHYGVARPNLPHDWKKWTFWQYEDKGIVHGVNELVDLNYFNGSMDDLKKL